MLSCVNNHGLNDPQAPPTRLGRGEPLLALAPMQGITDLPFWRLITGYGEVDLYFTEYFRVHATSRLEPRILKSITENPTGRSIVAQVVGEHIPSLIRTARELQTYSIIGVDLNLGCPAPIVCRKKVGGALLREPQQVDAILGALREAISINFSVKTRLGFEAPEVFDQMLPIYAKHSLDMLTVHGRTVRQMYRGSVNYDLIAHAAATLPCPVLANGDLDSAAKAVAILKQTRAAGVMIGRAAIGNPWIFRQIRQCLRQEPMLLPTGRQVWAYLADLFAAVRPAGIRPVDHVEKMKKYLNYAVHSLDPTGQFLYRVRRMATEDDFHHLCAAFLDHDRPIWF